MGLESHERGDKAPLSPPQQGIPRVRGRRPGDFDPLPSNLHFSFHLSNYHCLSLSFSLTHTHTHTHTLSLPPFHQPLSLLLVLSPSAPLYPFSPPSSLVVFASPYAPRVRWVTPGGSALTRYRRHDFWIVD